MIFSKLFFPAFVIIFLFGCQPKSGNSPDETNTQISQPDSLTISGGWLRPAASGQNSAAYLHIFNGTSHTDTLRAITTDLTEQAGIHETYQENGMTGMRPAALLPIAPKSLLKLQPGGLHIMLMNVNKQLAEGDSVEIQLQFSEAGTKQLRLPVKLSNPGK